MLVHAQTTIRRLLQVHGKIDPRQVDITFETPTPAWIASLTRPTINAFLYDLYENTELRQGGLQMTRGQERSVRKVPPRRFDLLLMVSALAGNASDEHTMLSRVLMTLLKHAEIPVNVVPEPLLEPDVPISGRICPSDRSPRPIEIWSGLSVPPRPGLLYVFTAPLDPNISVESPLVLTRTIRYIDSDSSAQFAERVQIGGVARTPDGTPITGAAVAVAGSARDDSITNEEGRFVIYGLERGTVTLKVTAGENAPFYTEVTIPSNSYDITVER